MRILLTPAEFIVTVPKPENDKGILISNHKQAGVALEVAYAIKEMSLLV